MNNWALPSYSGQAVANLHSYSRNLATRILCLVMTETHKGMGRGDDAQAPLLFIHPSSNGSSSFPWSHLNSLSPSASDPEIQGDTSGCITFLSNSFTKSVN